jgi:hypothetical protein
MAKGAQHSLLTAHGRLYGISVEHVTPNDGQLGVLDLKP